MNDCYAVESTKNRACEPSDGPRKNILTIFDEIRAVQVQAHETLSRISTMLRAEPIILPDTKNAECFRDDVVNALVVAKGILDACNAVADTLGGITNDHN